MKQRTFTSKLSPYIEALVKEKRSCGYSFIKEEYYLERFDRYIQENALDTGLLDETVVMSWAAIHPNESQNTRNLRLSILRLLSVFMVTLGIEAYVPPKFTSVSRKVPYLPSKEEMQRFFLMVDTWVPLTQEAKRWATAYPLMFRLYYLCGLRLDEACSLRHSDVSLETGRLYIKHSKGDKDRIIYVAEDLRMLLVRYDSRTNALVSDREWFFPGKNRLRPFAKTSIDKKFSEFWLTGKCSSHSGKPTVHALRHCFVVNRINDWVCQGENLDNLMPYLSRYLGHSSTEGTFYYYHQFDTFTDALRMYVEICNSVSREVYDGQ